MPHPSDWNPGLTVRGACAIAQNPDNSSPQMQRLALTILGGYAGREIAHADRVKASA